MADEGIIDWPDVDKHAAWIAGRTVGEGSNVRVNPTGIHGGGGVDVGRGFVHQSSGPSPHAPTGANMKPTWTISFEPLVDRRTYRHLMSLPHQAMHGLPKIWLPYPRSESWVIRGDDRTTWTMSATITGTGGARSLHVVPVVEVHDRSGLVVATSDADGISQGAYPGASTLTIVSGTPAAGEVKVDPAVDVDALVTGDEDLGFAAGHSFHVHSFSMVPFRILNLSHINPLRNRMDLTMDIKEAPEPRAWEDDV